MEHSVHCATHTFIEIVTPTPIHLVKWRLQACQAIVLDPDEENNMDTKAMMNELVAIDGHEDLTSDFDSRDLLGKILAFVNQVWSSPQA
jgi:hypothetical protein